MKIDREPLLSNLTAFALGGNGVVIGRPGAGKSFALAELRQRLKNKSVPQLFLAVERLGAASAAEVAAVLEREGDFVELLRKAVGNAGPGVLIFDGFDAARGETERAGVLAMIARAVVELHGLWHVIVSVRTFDAKKSQRLLDLFSELKSDGKKSHCRQFDVPLLSPAELEQALAQIAGLNVLYDGSTNEFHALLTVPFNLWLIEQVMKAGAHAGDFSNVTSEVQLLELYWDYRVRRGPRDDKEFTVKRAALEMVYRHTLTIPRDRVYVPEAKAGWEALLSDEVLTEVPVSQVSFAHNILFDFAVSVHLLDRDPEKLADFVATEPARPLFLRPSLVYHFTRLWHFDRDQFWRNYWTVVQRGEAHVRQIVRLVLPAVVVAEAVNLADLKPLLDHARSGEKTASEAMAFVLQALRVLNTKRAALWASFLAQAEFPFDRRYAWDAGVVGRSLLDACAGNAAVVADIGRLGRRLLAWAWGDRKNPDHGKWLERLAGIVAIPLVGQTFATDRAGSRQLLEDVLLVVGEPDFPIDTIFRLVIEVPHLIPEDPKLVGMIYERVFGHDEVSDEKTNMGGPVLALISNRRQDYDSCRYSLTEEFRNFLAAAPREAVRAGLRAVQVFAIEEKVMRYLRKDKTLSQVTEAFTFRGRTAHYIEDGSSIWDDTTYPEREMALADMTFNWLGEAAEGNRNADVEFFLEEMVSDAGVAVLWSRLLETANKHSATLGVHLWELALAEPIRDGPDTRSELGALLEKIADKLTPEQRKQLETSILTVPINVEPKQRERAERRRDRLLARLPEAHLVTPEAVQLRKELAAAEMLPGNERSRRITSWSEPYTDEVMFREAGVKPDAPANAELRSLYQPLQEWSDKGKNEADIDGRIAAATKLRDHMKQGTGADAVVVGAAETYLAMFASDALVRTKDTAAPRFAMLRELVLAYASHPEPRPDPEHDARWTNAVWSPTPRIESAQALPWLAHFRDDAAMAAIERLASDPVPAVRFLLICDFAWLGEHYADRMWTLLERSAATEQNPVVLQGITRVLWNLVRQDRAKSAALIQQLLRRVTEADDDNDEKAETNLFLLVTDFAVVHDEAWAKDAIRAWREQPVAHATQLAVVGRQLVAHLKPQTKMAHFERAQKLLLAHLDSVTEGLAELQKSQGPREELQKKMRQLYGVVDESITRTYFAADIDSKLKQRSENPLDDVQREKFFRDSLPVLKRILAFGQNAEIGMLLAPTAHYFMQLLNGVLRYDPPLVLEMAAQVVESSKRFSYNLDSMALRETVKLVEALLADHRHKIQDAASINNLLSLLDSFVDAGWPEALQLVWRLDEVYR